MPVVLVSNYYLGSINHTLLSTELLRLHKVPCLGLILNGNPTASTRNVLQSLTDLPILLDLPFMPSLTADSIALHAQNLRL
jgi:dethiobiotin synthetase